MVKRASAFALFLFLLSSSAFAFETALPPLQDSPAYQQFSKQPKSELAKLVFLLNRFKEAKSTVIYDSNSYTAQEASKLAKDFLMRNYHKETAEYWVKNYCHKTKKGNVILLKGSDEDTKPALELALEELTMLEGKK